MNENEKTLLDGAAHALADRQAAAEAAATTASGAMAGVSYYLARAREALASADVEEALRHLDELRHEHERARAGVADVQDNLHAAIRAAQMPAMLERHSAKLAQMGQLGLAG
jgi:ABC-type transporter Mla subunit MlaD